MSAPYSFRRYRPEDFQAVAALAVMASSSPETACGQPDVASADEFQADYGHRQLEDEAWVAMQDGHVVAFAAGALRNGTLSIDGPIVAPGSQGQGIGPALFDLLEQDARTQGAHHVQVGVRSSNQRGQRLLGHAGYVPKDQIYVYEAHRHVRSPFTLPVGIRIGDLKPRYLLPFLMIMHECFPGYRLPSTPQRLFEPDKMKIFLALDADDKPVGAVTAFFYPEDQMAYIYHLAVTEPHRRTGLGRALLLSATDWLWESHHPRFVGVSTSDSIGVRQSLIEPAGFALQYSLMYMHKAIEQPAGT